MTLQARALKTGDWFGGRRECHAAMMTAHTLHNPSASWYLDLVDALVTRGVEIDHEASGDSLWDTYPAESAALLLCHWRMIEIERQTRGKDDGAAA